MSVDPTTQLFFDATCLFAAAHSPSGGSAYLVLVCSHGFLQAVVSPEILVGPCCRNFGDIRSGFWRIPIRHIHPGMLIIGF